MRIDQHQTHFENAGRDAGHSAARPGAADMGAADTGVGFLVSSIIPATLACVSNAAGAVVATSRIHARTSSMTLKWAQREAGR